MTLGRACSAWWATSPRRWGQALAHALLTLGVAAAKLEHLDRVLAQFESYCTVTQSVGQGIASELEVHDVLGQRLK